MRARTLFSIVLLVGSAAAKICINATVAVDISARTGVFSIAVPQTNLDATTFSQNNTQQGRNLTEAALVGYATTAGTYQISTQFCMPSDGMPANPTVQVLTHGIGFDKTYWDSNYNDFNYSYVNYATDCAKYCTLNYDRLGIGNSSHGEPLNEIQSFLEIAALAELTTMLRTGTFPSVSRKFEKVVHVGHSFGSAQTYSLVNMYPDISDGIVLTGFSTNGSFVGFFGAGGDFVQANLNQPFRFGNLTAASVESVINLSGLTVNSPPYPNVSVTAVESVLNAYGLTDYVAGLITPGPKVPYVNGYLTNKDIDANQYLFFMPGFFDPGALLAGENTKQPVTVGELLTLGSIPMVNEFAGPVLIITGSNDLPFCGGNCLATGDPALASIPAAAIASFPKVGTGNFTTYIQPNTGHGLNFHYNQTGGYKVIQSFLMSKGL